MRRTNYSRNFGCDMKYFFTTNEFQVPFSWRNIAVFTG